MTETLVVIPLQEEMKVFQQFCAEQSIQFESSRIGKLVVTLFPDLEIVLACGGLGKTQFAIQTQYLLDSYLGFDVVICAGVAGSLDGELSVGDVVVATETVEYDIYNKFGKSIIPRYSSDERVRNSFRVIASKEKDFQIHFGAIASGDEDVINEERRKEIQMRTGGLVVAWEGAGGARACRFNAVSYVEIRGVTDRADGSASADFEKNLRIAMRNVTKTIVFWADRRVMDRRRANRAFTRPAFGGR